MNEEWSIGNNIDSQHIAESPTREQDGNVCFWVAVDK
jgi:hypothetical protein